MNGFLSNLCTEIHTYTHFPAAKEGEKDRLKRWSAELRQERETLEHRVGQLSNSITVRQVRIIHYSSAQ